MYYSSEMNKLSDNEFLMYFHLKWISKCDIITMYDWNRLTNLIYNGIVDFSDVIDHTIKRGV